MADVLEFEFKSDSGTTVNGFNKPVKVSVPAKVIGIANQEYLVFVKIEDGKIIPYGGKYNAETGMFDAERTSFSIYTVIENKIAFSDIASVRWADKAITVSAAKGIISGRGDGKYDPQGHVTKAEFATMLVKTFGLENEDAIERFSDVKPGDWFHPYVAAVVQNGLINGRSALTFDPNKEITRAEMATMAANALKKVLAYADVTDADASLDKFNDADQIIASLKNSVALMT